jgi:hypothetical protein
VLVNAIYADIDLPGHQQKFTKINAELCAAFPITSRNHRLTPTIGRIRRTSCSIWSVD